MEVQPISKPFGVSVFGSTLIRVSPDVASLEFAVSRTEKTPAAAFSSARSASKSVRKFLEKARMDQVGSSRVSLKQNYKYVDGERVFVGYGARVGFHVITTDLEKVEEILVGVVKAGANQIGSVSFQTTELKKHRANARTRAVEAAFEKARVYAAAAGARVGNVLHIEDVNPDILTGRNEGHVRVEIEPEDTGELRAFDPGSITVAAAVRVAYGILVDENP